MVIFSTHACAIEQSGLTASNTITEGERQLIIQLPTTMFSHLHRIETAGELPRFDVR